MPRIKHQKAYREGLAELPDWRITCFSSGRHTGARGWPTLRWLGRWRRFPAGWRHGGELPGRHRGRKVSGSFRYNATVTLVERHRFERVRQIGKHYWVVSRFVG